MARLTETEQSVLAFIRDHMADMGYSPSLREIAEEMDWKSHNTAWIYVRRLEAKGYVILTTGKARTIQLVEDDDDAG